MGKRQHQKDKMYVTYTEWTTLYGGKKTASVENEAIKFKRLPFDHCCLSMVRFEDAYCDRDGNVFEHNAVNEFLKKYKVNPVTGKPQHMTDLIKLNFYKNHEDDYHCPTLFKPFTKNSHIVAVAVTGNVFCDEAIEQLNIKTKNWKDLIDDTPFTRKDIITIQDPRVLSKFDISTFYHIQKNLRVETEEEMLERKDPMGRLKTVNLETRETLALLEKTYQEQETQVVEHKRADKFNAAHYSTGAVAASFTSTAMVPVSNHEAAIIDDDLVLYDRVKKKGYVRFLTSHGPLNLELFCDMVPKTCDNFIKLCHKGYYNGCQFHRSIRNFMIQGGDPTGSGKGGKSIWEKPFDDEIRPNLSHTGRGILSMANSGPNTNGSQFFLTYRSCRNLDGKHTIFGKIVGGIETLNEMEKIEVDNKDRPIENIYIMRVQVFVDPFQEAVEQLAGDRSKETLDRQKRVDAEAQKKRVNKPLTVYRSGIGKYLNLENDAKSLTPAATAIALATIEASSADIPKKVAKKSGNQTAVGSGFKDFSKW